MVKLSLLVGPFIYPNYTKNKSYGDNGNINNGPEVDNEILKIDRLPSINLNRMENESYSDNNKISNKVDDRVGDKMFFIEEI